MENQEQPKKSKLGIRLLIGILIASLMGSVLSLYLINEKQNDRLETTNELLRKKEAEETTCVYKRDSLTREVIQLSIYKSLTKAMVHRDEATSLLSHKIGDIIYLKRDSTQGVIRDVIIGGSKYEYYVKYIVLRKDNSYEEVIPELIY